MKPLLPVAPTVARAVQPVVRPVDRVPHHSRERPVHVGSGIEFQVDHEDPEVTSSHFLQWSVKYQREIIEDEINEWERLDSAGYSIQFDRPRYDPENVVLFNVLKTENDLLKMGFKQAYMFRPGAIIPLKGIKSRTKLYQFMYDYFMWMVRLIKAISPNSVVNTTQLGLAMIHSMLRGYDKKILTPKDILVLSQP